MNVEAGVFSGDVNINKSIILHGNQAGVNPNDGSWNDTRANAANESIIHGAVNLSLLNTITVDGFTIERTATNEGHILIGGGLPAGTDSTSLFTIQNNRIIGTRSTGTTWGGIHTNLLDTNPPGPYTNPGTSAAIQTNRIVIAGTASSNGINIRRLVPGTDNNSNLSITGNYIGPIDPNRGDGINLTGVQTSTGLAQITGNHLVGSDIFLYRTVGANIANNQLITPVVAAIAVAGNNDNITISGNTITNPAQQAIEVGDLGFNYPTPAPNSNVAISNNTVTVNVALLDTASAFAKPSYAFFDIFGGLSGTNSLSTNSLTLSGGAARCGQGGVWHPGRRRGPRRRAGSGCCPGDSSRGQPVDLREYADRASVGGAGTATLPPTSGLFVDTNLLTAGLDLHAQNNFINGWVNGVSVFDTNPGASGGLASGRRSLSTTTTCRATADSASPAAPGKS